MKLVSRFQAATRSTAELHGLLHQAITAFSTASRGSDARKTALISAENIEAELASRMQGP